MIRCLGSKKIKFTRKGRYNALRSERIYCIMSHNHYHTSDQMTRFRLSETCFEEGPNQWSFVGIPSTNQKIKDLLLEDALIILTRSNVNSTLNLMDHLKYSNRKEILNYLQSNSEFKKIYMSNAFFEWFTSCHASNEYFNASQIVNQLLPSIRLLKNQEIEPTVFCF